MNALRPELCSVHTHSTLCDGKASLSEMAAAACAAGVQFFGASGHSHTPLPLDEGTVLPTDMGNYRRTLLALREQYNGRMEILEGLELDNYADVTPDGFDYWIGSVHYLHDPQTEAYHAVDWDLTHLARCCTDMFHGNFPAMIGQYYQDVAAMALRRPTILGHMDIIRKLNGDGGLFDEEDRRYQTAALYALHAADPDATLLEVNTGAMARGLRTTPYPALFLLREWRRMGGRIILTSDAHRPENIVYGYAQAAELARTAGFQESILLTREGQTACPL